MHSTKSELRSRDSRGRLSLRDPASA
jgi:hypothetical protein